MQTRRGGGKAALFALTPEPADDKPTAPASSAVPEAAIKSGMFVEKGTASPVGFRPSQWTFDRPGETTAPAKAEDVVPARVNVPWTPTKQQLDLRRQSDEAAAAAQGEARAAPLALVPPFAEAMDPPVARAPQTETTPVPLQLVTPSASPPKPKRMIDLEALARKAEALRQELAAAAEDHETPAKVAQPAAAPAIKTPLSSLIVDDEDLIDTRRVKQTFDAERIAALLKPVPEGADSKTSSDTATSTPAPALEERVEALEEKVDALVPVAPVLALLDKSGIAHLLPKVAAPAVASSASSVDAPELEERVEALEEKVDSLAPAAPVLALLDKASEILPLAPQETAVPPVPAADDPVAATVDVVTEPATAETSPAAAGATVVRLSLPAQFLARIAPVLAAFGFMASRRTAAPKKDQPLAAAPASPAEPS
ncbi:MAG TPA: hypothetical protein VET85_10640, partial [Stellaceae bacterium]|nr:hypothetical protein [Stellaceae bacterium]